MIQRLITKFKAWKLGRQKVTKKTLSSGEIIIKTEDGIYFMAPREDSIPLLISREEGERLWNLEK